VLADGVAELDTRYAIETDTGHTIKVKNFGYRHGAPEVIAAMARGEDIIPLIEVFYHRFKEALYRTRGCGNFCQLAGLFHSSHLHNANLSYVFQLTSILSNKRRNAGHSGCLTDAPACASPPSN